MSENYWKRHTSRRRLLGAAGAAGAGAAGLALVGCGDDSGGNNDTSSLATPTAGANATPTPVDPYANAKKGGTFNTYTTTDAPSIDPYGNGSFLTKGISAYVYSRLFRYGAGPGVGIADLKPVPDLAEKFETSPDGLTWTISLRKDAKFQNVAPVSGHAVTTDDVKFSWGRVQDPKSGVASFVPFVDSVTYPDASTVVFKLKTPNAAFLDVLADTNVFFIMPKEADGGFDPATKMIGSGPWLFDSYAASVAYKFKKNPDWWVKGFPLMDAVNISVIPSVPNQLAQFTAGNLDAVAIPVDNLVDMKNNVKGIELYGEVSQLLSMFYFDSDPASPWNKDLRIRQAVSMAIDRDALTDLGYQVKKLTAAGLSVRGDWNNLIPAGLVRYWLDPKSAGMGDAAKNFKFDVAAAKALLSAAGWNSNTEVTYQYTTNAYGATFNSIAEAQIAMLNAIGIKTKTDIQDYVSKYKAQTYDKGNFSGIAFGYQTPFPEAGGYAGMFAATGSNNHSKINDPQMNDLWTKQAAELDVAKRKDIFKQIQVLNGQKMHYVPSQAGAGTGWTGYQSWLKGIDVQTVPGSYGGATEVTPFRWKNL